MTEGFLTGGPYGNVQRKQFGFEDYEAPPEIDEPTDWSGMLDNIISGVREFDPAQHHMGTLLKTMNYMQPENYGERMYDVFDASFQPYMSDEERAALPFGDPRKDAISSLAIGAGEAAAGGAIKYGPKLANQFADETLKMMSFGEIGTRDVLGHAPEFINQMNRKLGLPEVPFEQNIMGYHWGKQKGLTELDPAFYGEGMKGQEAGWAKYMDEDLKPTFFYLEEGKGVRPEIGVLTNAKGVYRADLQGLYDLKTDPDGLIKQAQDMVRLPAGNSPASLYMPELIKLLKAKGYKGYRGKSAIEGQGVAAVFGKTAVEELPAGTGMNRFGIADEHIGELDDAWYHGTDRDFDEFIDPEGVAGHFTRGKGYAGEYGDKVIQARLGVKNPVTIADEDWRMLRDKQGKLKDLKKQGYDAAISDDTGDIIPFYPKDVTITRKGALSEYIEDPMNTLGNKIAAMEAEEMAFKTAARGEGSSAVVGKSRDRVGTTGKYIGAPEGVDSPQKLGAIRKDYMETAKLGAAGREWYGDSSKWIEGVTPDIISGKQMADTLGVTSAGTNVDTNLGFSVKATVQDALGLPVNTGRFPGNQSPLIEEILAGHNPDLGPKRTPFAENLTVNWNPFLQERPVHDIWQGRAMGFQGKGGKPWEAGFSPQQHAWMDQQMDVINKRMNELGAEGFDDWDNLKTQAAAWTGAKIKAGELSIDDAAKHYGSFSPKYQANATHESVTGKGTGHLEGMADMSPEVRGDYSKHGNLWIDEKGRDMLYSDVGLMVEPDDAAMGAFKPAGGQYEFNPAQVSHPLVSMSGPQGARHVSPEAQTILNAVEGTRAYVDAQNAGAWHKLIAKNKAGESSSLTIPMDRAVSENEMRAIAQLAEDNGMFAVDTGRGINLINDPYSELGKARTGTTLGKELKKKGALGDQLKTMLPEAQDVQRVTADTGYIDYQQAWQAGEGSGEATQILRGLFDDQPELLNRLDQSAALRKKAAAQIDRDIEFAGKHNMPIREDLQTARRIIAESGLKGLFRALDQGVALPAIALGLLPLLTEIEDGSI